MTETPARYTTQIRVRYSETDAMGLLHHSNYLSYLEVGRTELFRHQGGSYRRMEELGLFFVVASVNVRFRSPARYDDVIDVVTEVTRETRAKVEHHYEMRCGDRLVAEADTVIACVDAEGVLQLIPDNLVEKTTEWKK